MDTIEEKLKFLTDAFVGVAALSNIRTPEAQELCRAVIIDLTVWREENVVPENRDSVAKYYQGKAEKMVVARKRVEEKGRAMWAELHTRARHMKASDKVVEGAWMKNFFARLPCGECKTNIPKHLKKVPVDFDNYFEWSVNFHNVINEDLGKPIVSIDSALDLYP